MGNAAKAKELYDQIPQFGSGWVSGVALYDQAIALIRQGKHNEARTLLRQPVSGEGADVAKVGLLSLLSAFYLRTGEVELARRTAQQALNSHAALKNSPQDAGFKLQVHRANRVIALAQESKAAKK